MKLPPPEVIAAARIVERWAAENGVTSWRIGALASRDELERTAARYAIARELGTEIWVERWAGMRRTTVTREDFDQLIDAKIARSGLSFGEVVGLAWKACRRVEPKR